MNRFRVEFKNTSPLQQCTSTNLACPKKEKPKLRGKKMLLVYTLGRLTLQNWACQLTKGHTKQANQLNQLLNWVDLPYKWGVAGGSDSKESTCNEGDLGSIPGLGRSPGGGHGNPLRYSCLENPHGQRRLVGYSPWGHKESDMTGWLNELNSKTN